MNTAKVKFEAAPPAQLPLPSVAAIAYERTVLAWADALPEHVIARRDLMYGPDPQHRYDVFTTSGTFSAPVLVFWHGGGWTNGYKEYVSFLAPKVLALGMVLVAPTYRLAPSNRLPAAYNDAMALLGHLQNTIAGDGGDPARLYLAGHSAGGSIAAMTALRARRLSAGGIGDAVRGCLPISGIMDLHHPDPAPGSLEERVYSMLLEGPEQDAVMSPLCWATENRVPMVLSYGEQDSERVIRSNQRLHALLACQPVAAQFHVHEGEDHFLTHTAMKDGRHPWFARLASLVQETSR